MSGNCIVSCHLRLASLQIVNILSLGVSRCKILLQRSWAYGASDHHLLVLENLQEFSYWTNRPYYKIVKPLIQLTKLM